MTHDALDAVFLPRWADLLARARILPLVLEKDLPTHIAGFRKVLVQLHAELGQLNGTLHEERFPAKRLTLAEVMEQATR